MSVAGLRSVCVWYSVHDVITHRTVRMYVGTSLENPPSRRLAVRGAPILDRYRHDNAWGGLQVLSPAA